MNPISTVCGACIFAEYDEIAVDGETYKSQKGCQLNRLEKHKRNGVSVVEATDPETGNEFYILDNCICTSLRTKEWIKLKEPDCNPLSEVREESEIRYQWILFDEGSIDDLRIRLSEINWQWIRPGRVVVVKLHDGPNDGVAITRLLSKFGKSGGWLWALNTLTEGVSFHEGIDCAVANYKFPFYLYSSSKLPVDKCLSGRINNLIVEELTIFGVLKMNGVTIIPQSVHTYFQGNSFNKTLIDKIREEDPSKVINV